VCYFQNYTSFNSQNNYAKVHLWCPTGETKKNAKKQTRTCKWKINQGNQKRNNLCKQKRNYVNKKEKTNRKGNLTNANGSTESKSKNTQIKWFGKRRNGRLSPYYGSSSVFFKFLSSRSFVKSRRLWVHLLDIFRLVKQWK